MTLLVHGVGRSRRGAAPDRGTAGGVGNIHLIAEELSSQLGIRRFAAAAAGARELQQGLRELAALHRGLLELLGNRFLGGQVDPVIEHSLLRTLRIDGRHLQSLLLGRTGGHAGAAARAVQSGNDHGEVHAGYAGHGLCLGALGSVLQLFIGHSDGTNDRVGAHIGALVALNAVIHDPLGNVHGHAALLIGGSALGRGAVRILLKGGNRQILAVEGVNGINHAVHIVHQLLTAAGGDLLLGIVRGVFPVGGNLYLHIAGGTGIDGIVVHLDHGLALLTVGLRGGVLHILNGVGLGNDLGNAEEGGLQNRVDAGAQANLLADLKAVDGIEINLIVGDELLHLAGQTLIQLGGVPGAVQQEAAALLQILHHVVGIKICGVGAGHEVGLGDIVGGLDGGMAKA